MVSTLTPRFVSIGELYTKAKIHGYTKNGEMFSVKNMVELAEMVLNAYYNVELISGGMVSHLQLIIDNLCKGNILVVPYPFFKFIFKVLNTLLRILTKN